MQNTFLEIFVQLFSIVDGLSVSLILGSVTILAILEITRKVEKEREVATTMAVLWFGVLVQVVYRGIDLVITSNMLMNKDMQLSDLSPVYGISLLLTIASVAMFVLYKKNKIDVPLFMFAQTAVWYTLFILSQLVSRTDSIATMNLGALILLSIVLVVVLILVLDSYKRYFLKKKHK
ncbi:MAG: hypothetical protein RI996_73 [Candidatus Parcubacteria bacterium]|jgi:hypothetical protein